MRASPSWVLLGATLCLSCSFNINKGRGFAGNSGNSALQLEQCGRGRESRTNRLWFAWLPPRALWKLQGTNEINFELMGSVLNSQYFNIAATGSARAFNSVFQREKLDVASARQDRTCLQARHQTQCLIGEQKPPQTLTNSPNNPIIPLLHLKNRGRG